MHFQAKTRLNALKRVFLHIIGFNAMKAWETFNRIELCKSGLISAKTSNSLRVNSFFSKNDVKCAKNTLFRAKNPFFAHYWF